MQSHFPPSLYSSPSSVVSSVEKLKTNTPYPTSYAPPIPIMSTNGQDIGFVTAPGYPAASGHIPYGHSVAMYPSAPYPDLSLPFASPGFPASSGHTPYGNFAAMYPSAPYYDSSPPFPATMDPTVGYFAPYYMTLPDTRPPPHYVATTRVDTYPPPFSPTYHPHPEVAPDVSYNAHDLATGKVTQISALFLSNTTELPSVWTPSQTIPPGNDRSIHPSIGKEQTPSLAKNYRHTPYESPGRHVRPQMRFQEKALEISYRVGALDEVNALGFPDHPHSYPRNFRFSAGEPETRQIKRFQHDDDHEDNGSGLNPVEHRIRSDQYATAVRRMGNVSQSLQDCDNANSHSRRPRKGIQMPEVRRRGRGSVRLVSPPCVLDAERNIEGERGGLVNLNRKTDYTHWRSQHQECPSSDPLKLAGAGEEEDGGENKGVPKAPGRGFRMDAVLQKKAKGNRKSSESKRIRERIRLEFLIKGQDVPY